jgi:hypothetical protein
VDHGDVGRAVLEDGPVICDDPGDVDPGGLGAVEAGTRADGVAILDCLGVARVGDDLAPRGLDDGGRAPDVVDVRVREDERAMRPTAWPVASTFRRRVEGSASRPASMRTLSACPASTRYTQQSPGEVSSPPATWKTPGATSIRGIPAIVLIPYFNSFALRYHRVIIKEARRGP